MNNRTVLMSIVVMVAVLLGLRFYLAGGREPAMASGAPIVNVSVPALAGTAQEGKVLFDANCATCHGANASGRDGYGPPLVHPYYRPNHHADAAFVIAARNGVQSHHWSFGNMPAVPGIDEAGVRKVIAYVRTLQRANGIE